MTCSTSSAWQLASCAWRLCPCALPRLLRRPQLLSLVSRPRAFNDQTSIRQCPCPSCRPNHRSTCAGSAAKKGLRLLVNVDACRGVIVLTDPQRLKQVSARSRVVALGGGAPATMTLQAELPACLRRHLLPQIFLNLLSNAVRYTEAGSIGMTCTACNCEVASANLRFTVTDTGIGIDADTLTRLWTPFMQGDTSSTRRFGGTGLGLSIVSTLACLMGGETGVTSTEGVGSTFWFTVQLPLAVSQQPEAGSVGCAAAAAADAATDIAALAAQAAAMRPLSALNPAPAGLSTSDAACASCAACSLAASATSAAAVQSVGDAPAAAGGASGAAGVPSAPQERQPLILVAEDQAANLLVIKRMLQRLGHTNIMVAVNGKEAVEAVATQDVDLVLMDCHMDLMDGFEACRRIRVMKADKRHVPVLAVTASALEPDRLACKAAGMDDVITKPLSISALRDALQRYLPQQLVRGE